MPKHFLPTLAITVLLAGCTHTVNLLNPVSPKFEGAYAAPSTSASDTATRIQVVSFNIKLAERIAPAIDVLRSPELRNADIISLQEMDEAGTERIARALGVNYIYYPGSIHPTRQRYFGPALLSRWPIEASTKVVLPHEGLIRRQRRVATGATIRIRGACVRAYAVHLETQVKASPHEREDQVDAILADAATTSCPVVVAGDFNSKGIGRYFEEKGYAWPTEHVGKTITLFSWDHIFVRGLTIPDSAAAGKVRDVHGASDHRPVWASVVFNRERGAQAVQHSGWHAARLIAVRRDEMES